MAEDYTQCVMSPFIPASILNDEDHEILDAFGFHSEPVNGAVFFFAEEYSGTGYIHKPEGDLIELDEEVLETRLQEIIQRSGGLVPWIGLEYAYTCSKMRPGGFGGAACFVTAKGAEYLSTCGWLRDNIRLMEAAA